MNFERKIFMKIKENLTIIEQQDIIQDIATDTGIEEKAIQDMLYSLRDSMEYYAKSVTTGESKEEKFLIRLFPSFTILIEQSKEQRKVLNNQEILVESRIRIKPKFSRYFLRKIVNNLKDG